MLEFGVGWPSDQGAGTKQLRAVLCAGLWVRVPSPLSRATLPTTEGIGDWWFANGYDLCMTMVKTNEYGRKKAHWAERSNRTLIIKFHETGLTFSRKHMIWLRTCCTYPIVC